MKQQIRVRLVYKCRRCGDIFESEATTIQKRHLFNAHSSLACIEHDCQYLKQVYQNRFEMLFNDSKEHNAFGIADLIGYNKA